MKFILNKENIYRKILTIFFWLIIFLFSWETATSYLDPDWGWHLQVGRSIAQTSQVPHSNIYNFSYTGNWVDHEWLFNLVLSRINDFGTYNLVITFFALLILGFFVLLNTWIKKIFPEKINTFLLMFFDLIIIYTISPHIGVRCQDIAWVFVLILFLSFTEIENQNNSEKSKFLNLFLPTLIWPPLLYLWACLHGSFLLGLTILGGWWAYQTIILFFSKKISKIWTNISLKPFSKKFWWIITAEILIAFGFTWITAYGLELYSFLTGYRDTYYLSHISEWLPQAAYPFSYFQIIFIALAVTVMGNWLLKIFIKKQKTSIPIWLGFLNIIFLFMAFKSRRHFPFLTIATLPFLIDFFTPLLNDFLNLCKKLFNKKIINAFSILCLLGAFTLIGILFNELSFISNPFTNFCKKYPCEAVKFLKQNSQYDQLKIFNNYEWGGFLIATYPEKLLFIDGRLPQVRLGENSFLEEYNKFRKKEQIENQIKKYSIEIFLIKNRECADFKPKAWELQIFPTLRNMKCESTLKDYLDNNSKWKQIYDDETSLIYVKKDE